jgi:hypothetical protein
MTTAGAGPSSEGPGNPQTAIAIGGPSATARITKLNAQPRVEHRVETCSYRWENFPCRISRPARTSLTCAGLFDWQTILVGRAA